MSKLHFSSRTNHLKASIRREADARELRKHGHWKGAMYLLGYAVECRLKVRLMEMYNVWSLDTLQALLSRRYGKEVNLKTHSIEYLFEFTGARSRLQKTSDRKYLFAYYECSRWNTAWRYAPDQGNEQECDRFFGAVDAFLRFTSFSV